MSGNTTRDAAPHVGVGNFHFQGVTEKTVLQQPTTDDPPPDLNVLSFLSDKVFKGKGFNNIFRPRSNFPLGGVAVPGVVLDNDLELNLTHETLTFSKPIGSVPNRGLAKQPDLALGGIMYVQSIQDVTNQQTGKADGKPIDIHIESGMWVSVPAAPESGVSAATLTRMGSIPHGTTINAQGDQPNLTGISGPPPISPVSITPFVVNNPSQPVRFQSQDLAGKNNRIPQNLDAFNANGVITQPILNDPTVILRNDLSKQKILKTITWTVSTLASSAVDGGGTANIAFLGGAGATATTEGGNANAFAHSMQATFWLETVQHTFSVPAGLDKPFTHQPNGEFGPTFVVPPTTGRTAPTTITTTFAQLQYLQTVLLNFAGLSWPHVSVATLADTSSIPVALPPVGH